MVGSMNSLVVMTCVIFAMFDLLVTHGQIRERAPMYPPQGHLPSISRSPPEEPHPAVCRIIVPEYQATSYGSGTLVAVKDDYGLVLTNWHVVRDAADVVTVEFLDGFQSGARVIRSDRDWDLAALVIWRPHAKPVPLASTPPEKGDVLTIAGYGLGTYRSATGHCTQYVSPGMHLPFEMVEVSVEARQGDSGGPIFNERGELAGVLFGAGRGTTAGSYVGRVGDFLTSISPNLGRPSSETMVLGRVDQPTTPTLPPLPPSAQPPDDSAELVNVPPFRAENHQLDPTPVSESNADSLPIRIHWTDLAGETPLEWAKSVLAIIGLLAILLRIMRSND